MGMVSRIGVVQDELSHLRVEPALARFKHPATTSYRFSNTPQLSGANSKLFGFIILA